MSQAGSIPPLPAAIETVTGNTGGAVAGSGTPINLNLLGDEDQGVFVNGDPATSTQTVTVENATAASTSGAALKGVSSFNSAYFNIDAGYVSLNASPIVPNYYEVTDPQYVAGGLAYSYSSCVVVDSTNSVLIQPPASTSVNLAVGANGILQSSILSGTVSVTAASSVVTFSTSQSGVLQIGDVITTAGGQAQRLISGSGTSWTARANWSSTETAVTFQRGGIALGTHYYVYAISNGSLGQYAASTRNTVGGDTLVDLPSGYTYYRQLYNTFTTPQISFTWYQQVWSGKSCVYFGTYPIILNIASGATSFTTVSAALWIPETSAWGKFTAEIGLASSGSNSVLIIRPVGTGGGLPIATGILYSSVNPTIFNAIGSYDMGLINQEFDYTLNTGGGSAPSITIYVAGYTVTDF